MGFYFNYFSRDVSNFCNFYIEGGKSGLFAWIFAIYKIAYTYTARCCFSFHVILWNLAFIYDIAPTISWGNADFFNPIPLAFTCNSPGRLVCNSSCFPCNALSCWVYRVIPTLRMGESSALPCHPVVSRPGWFSGQKPGPGTMGTRGDTRVQGSHGRDGHVSLPRVVCIVVHRVESRPLYAPLLRYPTPFRVAALPSPGMLSTYCLLNSDRDADSC